MPLIPYDPDKWLTSLTRSLQSYVLAAFDPDIVEVQMSYPDIANIVKETPLAKTIVHFEQDNHTPSVVGFGRPGDSIFTAGVGPAPGTIVERVADAIHVVNFDVGIWASVESGGETSRMEVHETLSKLLNGPVADEELAAATNGIHLVLPGLVGGRYILDSFNDVPVWRAMDIQVNVRVFGRRTLPPVTAIDTVDIALVTQDANGLLVN